MSSFMGGSRRAHTASSGSSAEGEAWAPSRRRDADNTLAYMGIWGELEDSGPGLACPHLFHSLMRPRRVERRGRDWFAGGSQVHWQMAIPRGSWDRLTDYVEQWLIRS